jgi:hypothetical protein
MEAEEVGKGEKEAAVGGPVEEARRLARYMATGKIQGNRGW